MRLTFPVSLADKYQPQTIDEFIGLRMVKITLKKFVRRPYSSAWLFVGPSGQGKTTMALAMRQKLGAELHHIPSQKCTVDMVEDHCRRCHYIPWAGVDAFHLVLVDEADKMSNAAQVSFLSKLDATDRPPQTIFIFTANSVANLEDRFTSRCRPLEFEAHSARIFEADRKKGGVSWEGPCL